MRPNLLVLKYLEKDRHQDWAVPRERPAEAAQARMESCFREYVDLELLVYGVFRQRRDLISTRKREKRSVLNRKRLPTSQGESQNNTG